MGSRTHPTDLSVGQESMRYYNPDGGPLRGLGSSPADRLQRRGLWVSDSYGVTIHLTVRSIGIATAIAVATTGSLGGSASRLWPSQ